MALGLSTPSEEGVTLVPLGVLFLPINPRLILLATADPMPLVIDPPEESPGVASPELGVGRRFAPAPNGECRNPSSANPVPGENDEVDGARPIDCLLESEEDAFDPTSSPPEVVTAIAGEALPTVEIGIPLGWDELDDATDAGRPSEEGAKIGVSRSE